MKSGGKLRYLEGFQRLNVRNGIHHSDWRKGFLSVLIFRWSGNLLIERFPALFKGDSSIKSPDCLFMFLDDTAPISAPFFFRVALISAASV